MSNNWYKNEDSDTIWWLDTPDQTGVWLFSFDKKRVYNLFEDYPHNLTPEQLAIFNKENPEWQQLL